MIIDNRFKVLGDVHLGREFIRNVPLHRRGEREQSVWKQFEAELNPNGKAVHVSMGDLFDKDKVSLPVIAKAASLYIAAANKYKDTTFYVLCGNHDRSRDLEFVSAFDIFSMIVGDSVICVNETPVVHKDFALIPWHPVKSASELIATSDLPQGLLNYAFGHWDVDTRSDAFNLIPTKELAAIGVTTAITGHDHTRRTLNRDGVEVIVTGSMQPYSHGEDPNGEIYVTVGLEDLTEPEKFKDKCVRVVLKAGEIFDLQIDCLSLQIERQVSDMEEGADIDVSLGDFDLQKVFDEVVAEFGIPESISKQLGERWRIAFS